MITTIDVKSGEAADLYQYLTSAITPRPIAFVSTISANGNKNLSPFSFFNVFSINPPVLVFSPVRRVRNNTDKDTLNNLHKVKECVIALVTEEIVQQVSLSSCDFDAQINEFNKAGFTEVKSDLIAPSRIKESPINF
jgi:flavin reductase (DIM6/NTAB) family NADH-FMN oxidoreductase RutF